MSDINKNADLLAKQINLWSSRDSKIIIGLDGYIGAGKSTLIENLKAKLPNVLFVNRDDFATTRDDFTNKFKEMKTETEKISLLVNGTADISEIEELLKQYKRSDETVERLMRGDLSGVRDNPKKFDFSKKVLLIEGIFLFHHPELAKLFDKKVFLDVDLNTADQRRRKREMVKWGDDYFPDNHPDSYYRLFRIGFEDYIADENPEGQADLILEIT